MKKSSEITLNWMGPGKQKLFPNNLACQNLVEPKGRFQFYIGGAGVELVLGNSSISRVKVDRDGDFGILGCGSLACVVRAKNDKSGKFVAIKILRD